MMSSPEASPELSRAARWMQRLVDLHGAGAREVLEGILVRMSPEELAALRYFWRLWARPKQLFPGGDWRVLLVLAGRGWGKTRAVNEYLREGVESGAVERFMLVGRTDDEAEKILVRGKNSGLLAISPPWFRPRAYKGDPKSIVYPNGAVGYLASAERPDSVRGENLDLLIWDEFAAAKPENAAAVLYNARMALRGSERARLVMATTSRKRRPILRELRDKALADPKHYRIIQGGTLENRGNLPRDFIEDLINEYKGTALWAQELEGEILEDDDGALWKARWFKRVPRVPPGVKLERIVLAVDPAVSTRRGSDQTGIGAAGLGSDGRVYCLADRSDRYTADRWPRVVCDLAQELGAQLVIVETNRGGDLAVQAIVDERDRRRLTFGVQGVFAHESKETRADPVTRLYERGLVVHVGDLGLLEEQQLTWNPLKEKSPDRIDAMVWAIWELAGDQFETGLTAANEATDIINERPRPRRAGELNDFPDEDEERGGGIWSGGIGWSGRI